MEFEQIVKQLEWLDNERRKEKDAHAATQSKLASLETSFKAINKQLKDLAQVTTAAARMSQFDEILGSFRAEVNKTVAELEKRYQRRETESNKRHQDEIEGMQKAITDVRKMAGSVEIKNKFKQQEVETGRLVSNLGELRKRVEESLHSFEETNHNLSLAEEIRRQELKRLGDLQGELSSMRKHSEENRDKLILLDDKMAIVDNRLREMISNEGRRLSQSDLLEQQTHEQAERERSLREWREKYEAFQKEAENLSTQVQTIDETLRNARRAQDTYLELNTKLERRINEVMELQRLAEDRVRQEWITFKAEDQKRWTGYNLSSEESFRDLRKDVQKLDKITSNLDELSQTMQDQLHQTTDTTERQLQELMNIVHQWMTSYERIMGHNKKAAKKTGA